uniref:Uncharacterized protein n=1 Tax=Avena sativa TaxID=4498 RepID=A0ACD5TY81_AVESA
MISLPLTCRRIVHPSRTRSTGSMDHYDNADPFSDDDQQEPMDDDLFSKKELTDGFSDERSLGAGAYGKVYMGVHEYGKKIAVKMLHDDMPTHADGCHEQFQTEFSNLKRLRHQNIVQLLGYYYETKHKHMEYDGRQIFSEKTHRALYSEYMHNGDLDKYLLSDKYKGDAWHTCYAIIKGICKGLKYLHEELDSPIYHLNLKPSNVLLDNNLVPKLTDYGLSELCGEEQTQITKCFMGTIGYVPPEYIEGNEISNKFDIFSLGAIIMKIMAGPTSYSRNDEMRTPQFVELVQGNWRNKLHATSTYPLESYSQQVRSCIEIALSCLEVDPCKRPSIGDIVNKFNETENTSHERGWIGWVPGSPMHLKRRVKELLAIHPVHLRFHFEPNKLIPCNLNLTNNTDVHVDFRCVPKNPKSFLNGLSRLHGTVPPNSTCTYIITMEKPRQPPANMDTLTIILESWVGYRCTRWDMDDYFSTSKGSQVDQSNCQVDKVTLTAVCEPTCKMMSSEPTQPIIKIMYCRDASLSEILSMAVHPTKPWILAAHGSGHVSIWNYETHERVMALRPIKEPAPCTGDHWMLSAKFITREQQFVAGDGYGFIHVLSSTTMDEITQFKAHSGWVESLAIHPSRPFVLSASDDSLIKLWNWESGWSCIQTFKAHSRNVQQVKFNPLEGSTFASASKDGTAKIWSFSSPIAIATLDCDGDGQICVDYFSPGGDRQYVVTGSDNGIARIWDLRTKRCIQELEGLQNMSGINVGVINGIQGNPILLTSSHEYAISLRNYNTYGYESTMDFKLDRVRGGFAYIKAIKSLVIGFDDGFAIVEMT